MIDRYPSPRSRLFAQQYDGVVRTVRGLSQPRQLFDPDERGRFRIGDVYIVQSTQDDGSIIIELQNAITEGPPMILGVLE